MATSLTGLGPRGGMTVRLAILPALLMLALANPSRADEIDDFIRARMEKAHIPAASVAIVRDGAAEKVRA